MPVPSEMSRSEFLKFRDGILTDSGLQIASPQSLLDVTMKCAKRLENQSAIWPFQRMLQDVAKTAETGFPILKEYPRMLFDPWSELSMEKRDVAAPDGFSDPPYICVNGEMLLNGIDDRRLLEHATAAHIGRVVQEAVFGVGAARLDGLPVEGAARGFKDSAREFVEDIWSVKLWR